MRIRYWFAVVVACIPGMSLAAGGDVGGFKFEPDVGNQAALQRGARTFVNYCLSCHSAGAMRYSRLAKDLDLDERLVERNLMFATDKIGSAMRVAMRPEQAVQWFGVAPPDLSVMARAKGGDYLYSFLLSFYPDDSKATGVNNLAFPDTAMPHVLWELQGWQQPVYDTEVDERGKKHEVFVGFETVSPGDLTEQEYRDLVGDLVNFLVYLGEPAQLVRYKIGFWVIAFLLVFLVVVYELKKEYWTDVH
jgi:ubiquinol-cytochrome c reductase cytochrome c1 subunit